MQTINCHIPTKLRITGRPSDTQLDQLGETLVRALQARISFAERTVSQGQHVLGKAVVEFSQERMDESRLRGSTYELPSYDRGGRAKAVLVSAGLAPRRAGPVKVRGEATNVNIFRFLSELKGKASRFRKVTTGLISGDSLDYGNQNYRLVPGSPLREGLTISAQLGEGVFFLQPTQRRALGLAALMAGGAYTIWRVDRHGNLHETGLQVITAGLGSIPEGILVYSVRKVIMAEVNVTARRPRDVAEVARRVVESMDIQFSRLNPGITVMVLLSILEPEDLTTEETEALLHELKRLGRLSEFLNYVSVPGLRHFLREKGIEWDYIYQNWEPSFNDSGLFYAGYLVGAAESVYDGLRLIGVLIGSPFSEEMAKERHQLWTAMKQFFAHPIINTTRGLKLLRDQFDEALWNLDFFEAGCIAGNVVVVILTLPEAVRALPKAARGLVKIAGAVGRLTLRAVEEMGVSLRALVEFMRKPAQRVVLNNGLELVKVGDEINVLDEVGNTVGRVVPKEFTPAEIAEWERSFQELGAPTPGETPVVMVPAFLDLEDLVRQAITKLRTQLGRTWLPSRHFGTRLHKAVEDLIATTGQSPTGWRVFAERTMREIANLPDHVSRMTLWDYLVARPHLREFLQIPEEMLKTKIGDLTPDLVIFEPGKAAVIWDLTAQSRVLHLAKTQLYANILQDLSDLRFLRIGETYWKAPLRTSSSAGALPLAGAAIRGHGPTIVEIGAGDLEASLRLARQGGRVTAVDIRRPPSGMAVNELETLGGRFVLGSARDIPSGSADIVFQYFPWRITGTGAFAVPGGTWEIMEQAIRIGRRGGVVTFVTEDRATAMYLLKQARRSTSIRRVALVRSTAVEAAPGATGAGVTSQTPIPAKHPVWHLNCYLE